MYYRNHILITICFFLTCFFVLALALPFRSDDVVLNGKIVSFYDSENLFSHRTKKYVVILDSSGEINDIQNDVLYYTASVGDDVKIVYSYYRNIFRMRLSYKDVVSCDLIKDNSEV